MEVFSLPARIPGGAGFTENHARALRWTAGLFSHWHWTPQGLANTWQFFPLFQAKTLKAIVFYQARGRWWGLVADSPASAVEAFSATHHLHRMRYLEGERAHVEAILDDSPELRRRLRQRENSLVLRRLAQDITGPLPLGFRPARRRDVGAFRIYHQASRDIAQTPSTRDLQLLIDRGTLFVTETEGTITALAKVMPGGSYRYISDVYTFPEFRRQGWARTLVTGLLDTLARDGLNACLCVAEDNLPGVALYQALGFEQWGARTQLELTL